MSDKILLSLFGALVGWGLKTAWDEYRVRLRWRRLSPLILRQLLNAAEACRASFDALSLPRAAARITAAQASAIELVAAGVREEHWGIGISLMADALDAIQKAQLAQAGQLAAELAAVRSAGGSLVTWAQEMQARQSLWISAPR